MDRREVIQMKLVSRLGAILLAGYAAMTQAGDIDGRAVIGGGLGGAAGGAVGSAVGGRTGAIIGAGVGGAAGAAIATHETKPEAKPVAVQRKEVIVVHERDCWPPGHCKGKKGNH
jgi:outer membrane lipoprotein SlyB